MFELDLKRSAFISVTHLWCRRFDIRNPNILLCGKPKDFTAWRKERHHGSKDYLISFVFFEVNQAVKEINEALNSNSEEALALALSNRAARLSGVVGENGSWYMKMLEEKRKIKQEVHFINFYLIRNCRQIQVLLR